MSFTTSRLQTACKLRGPKRTKTSRECYPSTQITWVRLAKKHAASMVHLPRKRVPPGRVSTRQSSTQEERPVSGSSVVVAELVIVENIQIFLYA